LEPIAFDQVGQSFDGVSLDGGQCVAVPGRCGRPALADGGCRGDRL